CYKSTVQNGKKSGEHEGGLTASGITEYSQEATARELEEDVGNLPFTSEEEMALIGGIRTQSRERISRRRIHLRNNIRGRLSRFARCHELVHHNPGKRAALESFLESLFHEVKKVKHKHLRPQNILSTDSDIPFQ